MPDEIEMIDVVSSNVASIGHNGLTNELRVRFKSGQMYSYSGVPVHVFLDLLNADSVGGYLAKEIKGNYPYRMINPMG